MTSSRRSGRLSALSQQFESSSAEGWVYDHPVGTTSGSCFHFGTTMVLPIRRSGCWQTTSTILALDETIRFAHSRGTPIHKFPIGTRRIGEDRRK